MAVNNIIKKYSFPLCGPWHQGYLMGSPRPPRVSALSFHRNIYISSYFSSYVTILITYFKDSPKSRGIEQ